MRVKEPSHHDFPSHKRRHLSRRRAGPGINSVISAATIRSIVGGCDVIGIFDGFKWLMEGSMSHVKPSRLRM